MKFERWHPLLLMIVMGSLSHTIFSQAYYTQLDNVEPFMSPSMNGLSPNRDIRASFSYRSNNLNINAPFHTTYLTVDGRALARYLNNKAWIGWGVGGLYDVAGSGQLSTTAFYANVAYHQMVSRLLLLSGGIGIGLNSKIVNNFDDLIFPIQWSSVFFDRTIPTQEPGLAESATTLDIRAGINVSFLINNNFSATLGASVQNINEPEERFYINTSLPSQFKIPAKYNFYAQVYNNINDILFVKNSVLFSMQGGINRFFLASSWEWSFSKYFEYISLLFGVNYRYTNIISPSLGFKYRNFRFLFSYDIFLDDLSTADYFYRVATEANANYFIKYSNSTFEQLIVVCPENF